ncbi:hypothetical protein [Paraflavitalea pollutisoli]|uniref:hypothetical protein n=1 Tax=Paraflavitalea pollutisoli TaxID=3034143 RepID=UPI0023ECF583|nr:hypothetical protein [Paraflavitalea sp. H1-2-19X]
MATPKKKSIARRAAASGKKAVATKKTATKKAVSVAKKRVAAPRKKAAVKKAVGKKIAAKKAVSTKVPLKKGVAKKAAAGKSTIKKSAAGKPVARKRSVKKGSAKATASAKKAASRKSTTTKKAGRVAGTFKGLPPLIRPSVPGETVIVEDITITDGKEIVFAMELIYTERLVSNDNVFDLHTQRDDKGQVIIDVYNVRKDGLVSIPGHRRIIFIGEAISEPLTNDEYLQEYAALKQALENLVLSELA